MTIEEFGKWLLRRCADNQDYVVSTRCCDSCYDVAVAREDESEEILSKFQEVELGKSES